jgi:putative ATP-dependent endonuclease of OLD family
MYLSRVFIKNYRSIKKVDISFKRGKNVIVGRNNSGKSNIVKAIDIVLGEKSPDWDKSENITEMIFIRETPMMIFLFFVNFPEM